MDTQDTRAGIVQLCKPGNAVANWHGGQCKRLLKGRLAHLNFRDSSLVLLLCSGLMLAGAASGQDAGSAAGYDRAIAAARSALANEDYETALRQTSEALKERPDDAVAKGLRADAETGKRQERARQQGYKSAQDALDAGNYDRAVELLELLVQGWPADAKAKALLANAQQTRQSKGTYSSILAEGDLALDAADYDKATARAKQALQLRPGDARASALLARATLRKQSPDGQVAPAVLPAATTVSPAAKTEAIPVIAKADQAPEPAPVPAPVANTPDAVAESPGPGTVPEGGPSQPRLRKNEISVSGDFFLGQGNVTLPFGFALANALNPLLPEPLQGTVNKADRSSDYFGGTVSYSYGQAWYLDLAYAHGSSSGNVPVSLSPNEAIFEHLDSTFSITDDWYQAYIRYTFPGLRGKRLSAYLRAGVSYVQATLTDAAPIPTLGVYAETDKTDDLLGNVGFGVGYSLYATRHVRLGVQVEGEGFYGRRSQKITETFVGDLGLNLPQVSINNDLYGGIGRGTVRFEYRLGQTGAFKLFADGGIQGKFTMINYSGLGSFDELLWGPYVKVGVRYAF